MQEARAQFTRLARALADAQARIEGMEADRSHDARKLEIDAYEAETGRIRALTKEGRLPAAAWE